MRFVTLCTLAALFAAGCGGGEQPAVGVADRVFKLEIDLDRLAQPACGDPSCVLGEHLEWVAPERGWWRRETEDGSGYRTTTVFAHGRYANNDEVRIGSPGFIGFLGRPPPSLTALEEREEVAVGDTLELPCGQTRCTFRVEEAITLAEAEERGIFTISVTEATMLHRELPPGEAPSLPLQAYWFGPEIEGRQALVAIELRTDDPGVAHVTFYGDPAEFAAGKTHGPGSRAVPNREFQLVSRPRTDPLVKREVRGLKARAFGQPVTLANGEDALAYRRAIITESTFVTIAVDSPGVDLRRMASALRPL